MRFRSSLGPALLLGLGATFIAACSSQDAGSSAAATTASVDGVPDSTGSTVTARAPDGTPSFVWAAPQRDARPIAGAITDIARAHLSAHANVLGISKRLVTSARISNKHQMDNGASVVSFEQKIGDVSLFRTRASVVMDKKNNLVAIAGNLQASVGVPSRASRFSISEEEAIAKAYQDRFGIALGSGAVSLVQHEANGEYSTYKVQTPAGAPRIVDVVRSRKVYVADKGQLVGAYHAEFLARMPKSNENSAWLYAIAADNGRTLVRNSLTQHEKFSYRVWAESGAKSQNNIPMDGPLTDQTPLPATATPNNISEKPFAAPILVSMEGFNKNPAGAADPWLAATATETKGNNVDAYTDRNDKGDNSGTGDGFDEGVDLRANTTAPLTFDRVYNTALAPNASPDQMKAAVTQIFYVTNWLHDYWYDSGFDEKSGNAQASNFGRGGMENDALQAQGQDAADNGQANNANMSSFSDGTSPRMQMYVWSGADNLTITTNPATAFTDPTAAAGGFGPQSFDVTGAAVLSTPADGCAAITGVTGKIAVIDRGTCPFTDKVKAAQAAGAIGVVIANNAADHTPAGMGGTDATITIPSAGVSQQDGALIKAKIAGGVTVHLKRDPSVLRDGTIDNTVVAHEWGHYLHHRLVLCGAGPCNAMSEGWADFDALMMIIKEDDDLENTAYPLTQYVGAAGTAPSYFGIRRQPYSSDLNKNFFTFKDISQNETLPTTAPINPIPDNAEDHNSGEVWAETLFEAYTNLLRDTKGATPRLDFTTAKRRMANYVVAGMKATPVEPDFVVQRDALLAVAFAADQKDFTALAKGFAKRGMGVGAVSPPVTSTDYTEVKEDFSFQGKLAYVDSTVDDAVRSCDRDGFLDADEKGDVTFHVKNAGWVNLKDSTATVTTTAAGVTFDNGGTATLAAIDPYGVATLRVTAAFDAAAAGKEFIPVTITIANKDSFTASVSGSIKPLGNFDIAPTTSKTDDVESPKPVWTMLHGVPDAPVAWTRQNKTDSNGAGVDPPNYQWVGEDLATRSDESLVSPSLTVSATEEFKISFTHKYSFENGPSGPQQNAPVVYFDGAVLEVSEDDGATWKDVTTYGGNPGYTHTINKNSDQGGDVADDNPLAGRNGYAGVLETATPVTVNLGTALAGKTVKVRFRVASDPASGEKGWEVDDIGFAGITNSPFGTLVDDASVCKGVPEPDAGKPQTVAPGAKVVLDGSASKDPDGDAITFKWSQLTTFDSEAVELTTAEEAKAGFTAPNVTEKTTLTFRVTVADAKQAAAASVQITVDPGVAGGPDAGAGGASNSSSTVGDTGNSDCGCTTVGNNGTAGFGALGAALAGIVGLVARKRRRS